MGSCSKVANSSSGVLPRSSLTILATSGYGDTGHWSSIVLRIVSTYSSGSRWSCCNSFGVSGGNTSRALPLFELRD